MCLVKFDIQIPAEMVSVLTTVSIALLALKASDETQLVIKAVDVLPVKE